MKIMRQKQYVTVKAVHMPDGSCVPWAIRMPDDSEYRVDRVLDVERHYAEVGGKGIRYTIRIGRSTTYLFDEENGRWFIEAKVAG